MGVVCGCLVIVARYVLPPRLIAYVRDRSIQITRERFRADVRLGKFDISVLFPLLTITGGDVVLTKSRGSGPATLISVKEFSVHANLYGFLRTPAHIDNLELVGMEILVPPRGEKTAKQEFPRKEKYPVILDRLSCNDCALRIMSRKPGREPLEFLIHKLNMHDAGLGRSAPYRASLTNAKPKGEIATEGRFGPWNPDEPSLTPLSGSYTFTHADLDPFPGIAGTLESQGRFQGVLGYIEADGETAMPDFALDVSGHPMPLHTQFHATIDGTSGDTFLNPVHARLAHSTIVAKGGIYGLPGKKGKAVVLDVVVNPGKLEDLLWLGVKANRPPMNGNISFHTELDIPPGAGSISDRLKLNGRFVTTSAEPTNPEFQEKLKAFSRRAQGKPKDEEAGEDTFDLKGRFILNRGIASFPALNFSIPGAKLDLSGRYALRSENIDFTGHLFLKAKLSQTTTGWKSLMLKAVDPFFKGKNAGAVLPIKITGTREHPDFKLSLGDSKGAEAHDSDQIAGSKAD
jgi:hypothetical protein